MDALGEGAAYGHYQYVVKFDPDTGAVTERIGLVEDIIGAEPYRPALFSVAPDYRFVPDDEGPEDFFHTNDVEELPPLWRLPSRCSRPAI